MEPIAVFRQIHRIGRVMLYETAISLHVTDFRSSDAMECIASKVNTIILLAEDYTAKQEQYVFPVLSEYEPSVVDVFHQKHASIRQHLKDLAIAVQAMAGSTEPEQRVKAGHRLEIVYTHFLRCQLKLMTEKEKVLHPLLVRYCQPATLLTIQQELIHHDDCQRSLLQANWIIKTLEDEDLVAWLKTVEKKATPHCLQLLLAAAEEQMEDQQFGKLTGALTERLQLA